MWKFYFEHNLRTAAFLIKLSDDFPKLAVLHVGYTRPELGNSTPLLHKYKTHAKFEKTTRQST